MGDLQRKLLTIAEAKELKADIAMQAKRQKLFLHTRQGVPLHARQNSR